MQRTPYHEAWREGPGQHRFYTRTYAPSSRPRASIVFIHGFADHIARYTDVHASWAQDGYLVFAYDLRGFGRTALDVSNRSPDSKYAKASGGQHQEDLLYWMNHISSSWPDIPVFLCGYSMGATIALSLVTSNRLSELKLQALPALPGIIAISPLFHLRTPPPRWLRWIVSRLAKIFPYAPFPSYISEHKFSRDPSAVQALARDALRRSYGRLRGIIDMLDQGEYVLTSSKNWSGKDVAVLQIWGSVEMITSLQNGTQFHSWLPIKDKKIIYHEGAYHDLLHDIGGIPEKVTKEVSAWIEERVPRTTRASCTTAY